MNFFSKTFILTTMVFTLSLQAVTLSTDTFTSGSADGWTEDPTGVTFESNQMRIDRDDTAQKTFSFPAIGGESVDFKLTATEIGTWESNDDLEVYVNGTKIIDITIKNSLVLNFSAQLDASGNVQIRIKPNTDNNAEDIYIDNVIVESGEAPTTFSGRHSFDLVNDATSSANGISSVNIRGDFEVAGNTAMCLVNKSSGYGGTCYDATGPGTVTSNQKVTRYIDIDGNDSTWSSSSSYITLPTAYEQSRNAATNKSEGILWAGLFWQGRLNSDDSYPIRYAVKSGTSFTTIEIGNDANVPSIDSSYLRATDANRILLDINGSGYKEIKAKTLYDFTSNGGTSYAAFAEVTDLVQSANLSSGDATFTVANLTTAEGREGSPGLFGGWSIVVIYAQDFTGKPRNITVYNGYDDVKNPSDPVEISGFKLPGSGVITSHISMFSGEGELAYSPDSIEISETGTDYVNIAGEVSPNKNVFDSIFTGVKRNSTNSDNELVNNNAGVDIDDFDLSAIITDFDRDRTNMFIRWSSGSDYITPSMMVFSTELYQPSICYDYTMDVGDYVIDSVNNDINSSYQDKELPLNTHISLRSLEGDFDLADAKITIITEPKYLTYRDDSAYYQAADTFAFKKVYPPQLNNVNGSKSQFTVNIGKGAGADGGVISAFETYFVKFSHDFNSSQSNFSTHMRIIATFSTDYGSGAVPVSQELEVDDLCEGHTGYRPEWGIFNVIDGDATDLNEYNLLTQIADRNFTVAVAGYQKDAAGGYTVPQNYDTSVEVEVFDIEYYKRDSNLSCIYPASKRGDSQFYNFNNSPFGTMRNDDGSAAVDKVKFPIAQRNAGFRVWVLVDDSGALVNYHANKASDEGTFKTLYNDSFKSLETLDKNCSKPQSSSATEGPCSPGGSGCYECIKSYWAKPICSRDNFSIRPEAFSVTISDTIENTSAATNIVTKNWTPVTTIESLKANNVVAGYKYYLDVNATLYNKNESADGYVAGFASYAPQVDPVDEDKDQNASVIPMFGAPKTAIADQPCNYISNEGFSLGFFNGKASNNELVFRDVGEYKFHVIDNTWTEVDNPGRFGQDCLADDATAPDTGRIGCNTSSDGVIGNLGISEDVTVDVFPFAYNITNVALSTPSIALFPGAPYMYSNNLADDINTAPYSANDAMSVSFAGNITAVGKDASPMTNFVKKCYARNMKINLNFVDTAPAGTALRWKETRASKESNVTEPVNGNFITDPITGLRVVDLVTGLPVIGATDTLANTPNIGLNKSNFEKLDEGATNLQLFLNYNRSQIAPHDPISLTVLDIKVDCLTDLCEGKANGVSNFNAINADPLQVADTTSVNSQGGLSWKYFNQSIMVYYARAHTPRHRIAGPIGQVTTFYEVFCNLGAGCTNADLVPTSAGAPVQSVDDINWYQNVNHIQAAGDIVTPTALAPNPITTHISSKAADFIQLGNGQVTNATTIGTYQYNGLNGFPYKATVDYTPNSWLIFDRFDATATTNDFEIEFFGAGDWGGIDVNNQNTNTNPAVNTNRRIQW